MKSVAREAGLSVRQAEATAQLPRVSRMSPTVGGQEGLGEGGVLSSLGSRVFSPRGQGGGRSLRTGGSADTEWGWAGAGPQRSAPCGSCIHTLFQFLPEI